MRRVPVIHAITKLEFGGAQQNTLYTAANLDRARFEPVLVTGPDGYLMDMARGLGVDIKVARNMERPVNPVRDLLAYRDLVRFLSPYGGSPAIVHTHSSKAGILGRWAAWKAGIPVIIHSIHGFGFTPRQNRIVSGLYKGAERMTSRITDRFIAVSVKNLEDGIRLGLFDRGKCTVIRSGFNLEEFRTAAPLEARSLRELGIPPGAPLVFMAACLKPQKAPLDFVRAAARVHEEVPAARFLLAGDGELKGALDREVSRAGLAGVFFHLGWREDIARLMKSSRIVVLTSLWEGLPRVIPQARAAGRPVVATAVDGSAEAVRDGVDGYLCAPGDVDGLARKVVHLLRHPEECSDMGHRGMENVDEWDQDTMVRRQEELYEGLLREKGLI